MADAKLTDLTAVTAIASGDKMYVVDVSDSTDAASGTSKQVTVDNLFTDRTITTAILAGGTVVNEAGADVDFRVEGDTNQNLIFVDASTDKVGFGTATPAERLHVIGNFQVADASTATKAYRFRTSGSSLDLDAAGESLVLSTYSAADFTGTQRTYMKFFSTQATAQMYLAWEIQTSGGATVIEWNPNVGTGGDVFVINQQGEDKDTRIEGDTDADLVHVDASTDRVGIGVAAPSAKLHVGGDIATTTTGNITIAGTDPKVGARIPASALFPATTNGCAAHAQAETTTNKINYKYLAFDGAAEEYAWVHLPTPDWWDLSTIKVRFHWTPASGSGDVIWGAAGLARSDDDALDTALGTAVTVTDTVLAVGDEHITAYTSAITVGGTPAKSDALYLRVYRDADAAGDTLNSVDAYLIAISVQFGRGQYDDQ